MGEGELDRGVTAGLGAARLRLAIECAAGRVERLAMALDSCRGRVEEARGEVAALLRALDEALARGIP